MLTYALVEFDAGPVQLLQEAWRGRVQRYTDLDGKTVEPPTRGGSRVIDANVPRPVWAVDPVEDPVVVSGSRRITKLAFRNRFTAAEKATIEIAAVHNQSLAADHASNLLAAGLRASLADQRDAWYIDLDRADTRGGVVALETYRILGAGRALQILDAPIQDGERHIEG